MPPPSANQPPIVPSNPIADSEAVALLSRYEQHLRTDQMRESAVRAADTVRNCIVRASFGYDELLDEVRQHQTVYEPQRRALNRLVQKLRAGDADAVDENDLPALPLDNPENRRYTTACLYNTYAIYEALWTAKEQAIHGLSGQPLPGFKGFDPTGVTRVRNSLSLHYKPWETSTGPTSSVELGALDTGPKVRPGTAVRGGWSDPGLRVNVEEYATELARRLRRHLNA